MNVNEMFPGRFLKGEELQGKPVTVTIAKVIQDKVYKPGKGETTVFVLHVQGGSKGVVLSKPLALGIAEALGESDTDNWGGKRVTLYPQPMQVAGRNVIAIRARKANQQNQPAPTPQGSKPTPNSGGGERPNNGGPGTRGAVQHQANNLKTQALANMTIEDICPTSPKDWSTLYLKAAPWFGLQQGEVAAKVDEMGQVKDAILVFEALKADWLDRQQVQGETTAPDDIDQDFDDQVFVEPEPELEPKTDDQDFDDQDF